MTTSHVRFVKPIRPASLSFGPLSLLFALSLVMVLTASVQATQVTFQWNASTGAVAGYKLYQGTASQNYVSSAVLAGTATTGVMDLDPSSSHYVAATAYDSSQRESAYSNEILCHPVAVSGTSGGSISPSGTFFVQNTGSVAFSLTPNSGYRVNSLMINGTSVGSVTNYTLNGVTGKCTVSAIFEPIPATTYTITVNSTLNGSISPSDSVIVAPGSSKTFTISPNDGYHIADVTVDGKSAGAVSSYQFDNITTNHSIGATFAINTYTIGVVAGANGKIQPGSTTVNYGASQAFTITANTGYHIADVLVDGKSVGALTSYPFTNVTQSHTISASFAIDTYTITVTSPANGTISPSGSVSVSRGANQSFTITPAAGYQVSKVLADGSSAGAVGSYTFYNVTSGHTLSAEFVQKANQPPVAAAGPDQTLPEGSTVALNGANSSDPDDGIASYTWTQSDGPAVSLSDVHAVSPTFTAPDVGPSGAALTFKLSVSDKAGLTSEDTCIVNVSWVNQSPTANAGSNQTVSEGTQVQLDGSGSTDPDDGIRSYQWVQKSGPGVSLSNAKGAIASFQAPSVGPDGASVSFELTVTDKGGLKSTAQTLVNVAWVNAPPVASAGSDQTAYQGEVVTLDGSASSDPDDGIATYYWTQLSGTPVTFLNDPGSAQVSFYAPELGPSSSALTFQLTVKDASGLQSSDTCVVSVIDRVGPDLTSNWSALTYARNKVSGSLVVRNMGSEQATSFYVGFYLSSDGKTLDKVLGKKTLRSLNAGQGKTVKFTYKNSTLTGQYIVAVADYSDKVVETAEDNNQSTVVIPAMTPQPRRR